MAKLYPPHIEGTIPAFGGTTLVVPFSMNRAVSALEVNSMALKVKKVNTNEVITTKISTNFTLIGNCSVTFDFSSEDKLVVGQFYRIQIAFVDSEGVLGYFSTVGVVKYTGYPTISIVGTEIDKTNIHSYDYVGKYEQTMDPTEKLYSSQLVLYDYNGKIVLDSGEIVHSVLNDTLPNQALELFQFDQDLEFNQIYYLQLTMTTINKLVVHSPRYKIMQRENTDMVFDETRNLKVRATSDFEEGNATITLYTTAKDIEVITGTFILSRTEAIPPYHWRKIHNFLVRAGKVTEIKFKDYTVEQGKTYIYSVQQYNNSGVYSGRILSNEIYVNFEDMFLLDGKRQLKIRFNPKVSSMKNNILETKTNTIGSKYPFITRNGHVNHKEFALSGLVSYQMDKNSTFIDWKKLNLETVPTPGNEKEHEYIVHSNLTSDNIFAERIFKLEVLEWLNDGKPKILKTPTEGNYIVRIMGVTMAPNDTLGRMLHTFNCTATEIAPFEYKSLDKFNFIEIQDLDKTVTVWKTIKFAEPIKNSDGSSTVKYSAGELLNGLGSILSIRLTDMTPGSKFYINNKEFYIGTTGSYFVRLEPQNPIYSFKLPEDAKYTGSMLIEYKDVLRTSFDDIKTMTLQEIPAKQIIGEIRGKENIIEGLNDVKSRVINIPRITFEKRGIHKIYTPYTGEPIIPSTDINSLNLYVNGHSFDEKYKITPKELEILSLYEIQYSLKDCDILDQDGDIFYVKDGTIFSPSTGLYYDPYREKIISSSPKTPFWVNINDEIIDLTETEERTIRDMQYTKIILGEGIIADLSCFRQVMEYSFEKEHEEVAPIRNEYDAQVASLKRSIVNPNNTNDLDLMLKRVNVLYDNLVFALEKVIKEKYTQGG